MREGHDHPGRDELDVVPHLLEPEQLLPAVLDLLPDVRGHVEEDLALLQRGRRLLERGDLAVPLVERVVARVVRVVRERRALEEVLFGVGGRGVGG